MLMLAVSAESWFVESPLAGPHKHSATHTMTQWRLCGFIKVHQQQERKGKAPQKCDWCLCLYLYPSSSALFPSVYPMPAHPPTRRFLFGSAHLSLFPLPSNKPVCLSPSSPSGMFLSKLLRVSSQMHRRSRFMNEQT